MLSKSVFMIEWIRNGEKHITEVRSSCEESAKLIKGNGEFRKKLDALYAEMDGEVLQVTLVANVEIAI